MGHPVHFLKSYSIFPSNFSAVPGDDDRAVLHPGGQPLVQVINGHFSAFFCEAL